MLAAGFLTRGRLLAMLAVALAGCVNAPRVHGVFEGDVVIADSFERKFVGADNVVAMLQDCLPNAQFRDDPRSWQFPLPNGMVSTHSSPRARTHLMIAGSQAVCVQETMRGFPVLPVEAFERLAFFQGVPRAEQQQWFRQVGFRLAAKGTVELKATNSKGDAYIISFGAVPQLKGQIFVTRRFVAKGDVQEAINPQSINVFAAGVTGLLAMEQPLLPSTSQRASNQQLGIPTFTGTATADFFKPAPPMRIERSVLTDMLPPVKQ